MIKDKQWHFLIVRFSSLGDLILNSSFWESLKERWGGRVKVSLLTSSEYSGLFENHPYIDNLYCFDRRKHGLSGLNSLINNIHKETRIDLLVDMHGSLRSLFIRLKLWNIPRIFMDKRTLERGILTWLKLDLLSKVKRLGQGLGELLLIRNVADYSQVFDIAPFVGDKGRRSSCTLTFRDDEKTNDLLNKWDLKKYICVVPSASYPEKRWPVDCFKQLLIKCLDEVKMKDYQFVILAGPADDFCDQFKDLEKKYQSRFINLQGKTSIIESTQILKHADFCVGNDTGLPHIAESLGVPAIFILGPTGEEFGFYPHLPLSKIHSKKIWCRPCTTNGKGFCIRSERFCLTTISPDEVFKSVCQLGKTVNG